MGKAASEDATPFVDAPAVSEDDAKAAAKAQKSRMAQVEEMVEAWFEEHVRNTAIAHEERAYNQMMKAKDELKKLIVSL